VVVVVALLATIAFLSISPESFEPARASAISARERAAAALRPADSSDNGASWSSGRVLFEERRQDQAERRTWTAVGIDGGGAEGLIRNDGTFSAGYPDPGFSFWLRDNATGEVLRPTRTTVTQSLVGDHLPLVRTEWKTRAADVTWTIFGKSTGAQPIDLGPDDAPVELVQASVTAGELGGEWTLLLVARPDDPTNGTDPITWVAGTPTTLAANGKLALLAQRPADIVTTIDQASVDPDTIDYGNLGNDASSSISDHGLGLGVLGYSMRLAGNQTATFGFALPLGDTVLNPTQTSAVADLDVASAQAQVASAWKERLEQVQISLPDHQIVDAFYASIAYMLMARANDSFFSGPTAEHAAWVRDSAYIGPALTRAGQARVVEPVLRLLVGAQLPSGREPPIIEANGAIRQPMKTEWDAQGQLIYQLLDYATQTRDPALLNEVYPVIRSAAVWQKAQIDETKTDNPPNSPFYGIVPAGESAEDLYSDTWHHYWDDFWALTGFHAAATVATQLGHADDAATFTTAETALRANVLQSVPRALPPGKPIFIPNGPEDIQSTAMARSATPSVFPEEVLDPTSLIVVQSFESYYQWTVQPYGGAYMHYGNNYWPYAGIDLAHAFYQLAMYAHAWQMLDWAMAHQTAPNLYAWGEVVDPQRLDLVSGDVPHSWMSAELVRFIRDILIREQGDHLIIGPYPDKWIAPGATVSIHHAPTSFGVEGYTLTRSADGKTIHVQFEGDAPSGGYVIVLPNGTTYAPTTASGSITLADANHAVIPASVHEATLTIATK
jgi:hypothetical protein